MTAHHLHLKAPGEKRRPNLHGGALVHLDEPGLPGYPLHHNLHQFYVSPESPPEAVAAFLMAALGVWAADKLVSRRQAADAWTRSITLALPANDALAAQFPRLAEVLHFLTGDAWTLLPRPAPLNLGFAAPWPCAWRPQAVVLFSGGLDSLAGAVDLLEAGQRLLLVSHHDFGQLAATQQRLAALLGRHYGPDRFQHLSLRVQFPESPELTLRSRSLLYLALGLTAAAAFGPATALIVPENGWVSLNPPLTGNRMGPYSTRTTHPHFLAQLTALWQQAGIFHPLINPCHASTKGALLEKCRNRSLLERLAPQTISCARPEVGRWQGRAGQACGYCYPCLIRRAALHRLGWDNGGDYRVDVLAEPEIVRHRVKGSDLRAMLIALKTWQEDPAAITSRLWLDGSSLSLTKELTLARRLLAEGFQEIADFLRNKGGTGLATFLGENSAPTPDFSWPGP